MNKLYYMEGIFKSIWLSKFINQWFFIGEQFNIEKIIYFSFFLIKKKLKCSPIFIFFEVLEKIRPLIGLKIYKKKKRKLTKVTASPIIIKEPIQYKRAIFWLATAIKFRKEKFLSLKILQEFYGIIFFNTGNTLKKKKEFYQYAIMYKTIKKFKW